MKKILVTGGFGFIGSTLVDLLTQVPENQVHIVDDMSTSPINIDDYLTQLGNRPNLSYDIITVEAFFTRKDGPGKWDQIYHLASPVGPAGVLKHAGNMVRDVVRDAYLIMDYCLENDIKFLDVSTSEIYGGGQSGYCPESTPKIVPAETTIRLEYAIAKLAAETAIINTCRAKGLKCTLFALLMFQVHVNHLKEVLLCQGLYNKRIKINQLQYLMMVLHLGHLRMLETWQGVYY